VLLIAHHVPQRLKGEERYFSIPFINLHFNKKGVFYNGGVTAVSAIIGKMTNTWVFLFLFLVTNIIAYPLAHATMPKRKLEGGGVPLDVYVARMLKYKYLRQNLYIRKRGS
jgi:hypothetical protein